MKSAYLLEPALATWPGLASGGVLDDSVILQVREQERQLASVRTAPVALPGMSAKAFQATGMRDGIEPTVLLYAPASPAIRPVLLHIHGGGFIFGSAYNYDMINQHLAAVLDCAVLCVDYRLAPDAPYPAALDDCDAALRWLAGNAAELSIDPARIVVMGESAGGGLAASLCQLTRDQGGPALAGQILVYPMLDDRTSDLQDPHPFAGEYLWTRDYNRYAWSAFLGSHKNVPPEYAVPARTANLAALPPATIFIGALDLFLEETLEYARRLTRAGIPTELHVYSGAYHGFDMVAHAASSIAFGEDRMRALRKVLAL